MTVEELIRYTLINDTAVKAIIASRCYPVLIPQDPTYPLIVYYRLSGLPDNTLTGSPVLTYSRFQIEAWANTYSAAKSLAGAISDALNAKTYSGTGMSIGSIVQQGERDSYEEPVSCYRVMLDFTLWHTQ